jgi:hypothetical protein
MFQSLTAQYLVTEYRNVRPGDRVLVHSAAGGVGLLLVQWLKHLGAQVIGTTSNDAKAAWRLNVRECGREDKHMEINRVGLQASSKGPAEWFTGAARIDPLFQARGCLDLHEPFMNFTHRVIAFKPVIQK